MADDLTIEAIEEDVVFHQKIGERCESIVRFFKADLDRIITCIEAVKILSQQACALTAARVTTELEDIRVRLTPMEKPTPGFYIMYRAEKDGCYHIGFKDSSEIDSVLEKLKALKQPAQV